MRCYQSHESARQKLEERYKINGRLEFDDLLRYLEDVSSEPASEEAYGLAISLRSMRLQCENVCRLLHEAIDRLSRCRVDSAVDSSVFANLGVALDHLNEKRSQMSKLVKLETPDNKTDRKPQQPSRSVDPELQAACNYGYQVSSSIRRSYKWQLFHHMAALSLCWTCIKPSSHASVEPLPWIEEDVFRMFP